MTAYIKFFDGPDMGEMTSFYFYYPEFPKHIPRWGDMCKAAFGQVFVLSGNNLKAAKSWAETKWGVTIRHQDGQYIVCKLGGGKTEDTK